MPRQTRSAPGGWVYHVINRAVARLPLFRKEADYAAFERVMLEAYEKHPTRILTWCLMRNHWHFVVWPQQDDELTAFFRWLTHTHVMRWHVAHKTVGCGSLYQGRFKSFPIQRDDHFLTVCRYVERNALTANLVDRAENWRWSGLWVRNNKNCPANALLSDWPVDPPHNWLTLLNKPMSEKEVERVKTSIKRNRPFGSEQWQKQTAARLGLTASLRKEGRPKKNVEQPAIVN